MKKFPSNIHFFILFLFCLVCTPFFSHAKTREFDVGLRLYTSGQQSLSIDGTFLGDLRDAAEVDNFILFFAGVTALEFGGSGGFVSLNGMKPSQREAIRSSYFHMGESYLQTYENLGITNAGALTGSFINRKEKIRLISSALGGFLPGGPIPLGEYEVLLSGTNATGKAVVTASGRVTISNFIPPLN